MCSENTLLHLKTVQTMSMSKENLINIGAFDLKSPGQNNYIPKLLCGSLAIHFKFSFNKSIFFKEEKKR